MSAVLRELYGRNGGETLVGGEFQTEERDAFAAGSGGSGFGSAEFVHFKCHASDNGFAGFVRVTGVHFFVRSARKIFADVDEEHVVGQVRRGIGERVGIGEFDAHIFLRLGKVADIKGKEISFCRESDDVGVLHRHIDGEDTARLVVLVEDIHFFDCGAGRVGHGRSVAVSEFLRAGGDAQSGG